MLKILIPTCRMSDDLKAMIAEIRSNTKDYQILMTCENQSAAFNRNRCLVGVPVGEVAIMLDDDIAGFYPGWAADLLIPFADTRVVMVSARLLKPDGTLAQTCSRCYQTDRDTVEIMPGRHSVLPTAAIAFRHRGHLFDEAYRGSGFEDSDWCFQYLQADHAAKFLQSNKCRLVHRNEMKHQREHWAWNKKYFESKWPEVPRAQHA